MRFIKKLLFTLKYGKLTQNVVCTIGGHDCEIEYVDKNDRVVGYFAYGNFDPQLPYVGQFLWRS